MKPKEKKTDKKQQVATDSSPELNQQKTDHKADKKGNS